MSEIKLSTGNLVLMSHFIWNYNYLLVIVYIYISLNFGKKLNYLVLKKIYKFV